MNESERNEKELYLAIVLRSGCDPKFAERIADTLARVTCNREELLELSTRSVRATLQQAKALAYELASDGKDRPEGDCYVDNEFVLQLFNILTKEISKQSEGVIQVHQGERIRDQLEKMGQIPAEPSIHVGPVN